jgi:BON domain
MAGVPLIAIAVAILGVSPAREEGNPVPQSCAKLGGMRKPESQTGKRIAGACAAVLIVGAAVAAGKRSDLDTLARVGEVVGQRAKAAAPNGSAVAGPLTAFKVGDRFPLEEQVRVRIQSDRNMAGAKVDVVAGAAPGEVRLRGEVVNPWQERHAFRLATETTGVEKVVSEIAVPVQ